MLSFKHLRINILFFLLLVYITVGYSQKADSLNNLLNKSTSASDKARILNELADYYSLESPQKSILFAEKALELALKNDIKKEVARSYNLFADYYYNTVNIDSAIFYNSKALVIASFIKDEKILSNTYRNLGITYANKDIKKAKDYYSKAIRIFKKLQLNAETGATINYLGLLYIRENKYDEAIRYFREALPYDSLGADPINLALTFNNLGIALHYKGNYPSTLDFYLKAMTIYEKCHHESYLSTQYHNIGCVYLDYKNYDKALEYYNKSIIVKDKLNNKIGIAFSKIKIAVIKIETGKLQDAQDLLLQTLEIFKNENNKSGLLRTYRLLGELHYELSDYERSLNYFEKASVISEELSNQIGIAEINQFVGKIKVRKGFYTEGISHLKKGLAIVEKAGYLKLQKCIEKDIADAYITMHKYKNAVHHLMQYMVLDDSLGKIQNNTMLSELENKYNSEKKMLELQMALKDKKLQEVELKKQKIFRNALIIGAILVMVILLLVFNNAIQKILISRNGNKIQKMITPEKASTKVSNF